VISLLARVTERLWYSLGYPRQQSGQCSIRQIYGDAQRLRARGKVEGQYRNGQAKSTIVRTARRMQTQSVTLPETVGKYSRNIDPALSGRHTRTLYDAFKRTEASVLAQLRTGMSRLNGYLFQIGAAESDRCGCGAAKETIQHFLFRCIRWKSQRAQLLQQTTTRRGCLSFYL
jgi:hypothetical protein